MKTLLTLALVAVKILEITSEPQKCTNGSFQSPINIITSESINDCSIYKFNIFGSSQPTVSKLEYRRGIVHLVTPVLFSFVYNEDKQHNHGLYTSNLIQLHTPSEHTIDGKQYDAEIQIVYESAVSQMEYLIISVLMELDTQNSSTTLFDTINLFKTDNFDLDLQQILIAVIQNNNFYTYEGSLTTYPCTQQANWYISDQILPIRTIHLKILKSMIQGRSNNRPVQPLQGREVYIINNTCNNNLSSYKFQSQQMYDLRAFTLITVFLILLL